MSSPPKAVEAHFVSKSYLKQFCDPELGGRKLWKCSYVNRQWQPRAPKKIARAQEYYAKAPIDSDIERILHLIESPVGELYSLCLNRFEAPQESQRELFAAFAAMSWIRSPRVRNELSLWLRGVQKKKIDILLGDRDLLVRQIKLLEAESGKPIKETPDELIAEMRAKEHEILLGTPSYITELTITNFPVLESVARTIKSLGWKFFISPRDHNFITSDSPVHWRSFRNSRLSYAKMLREPDAEVIFPLSRNFCFVGGHGCSSGVYLATPAEVEEINYRTLREAHLEIYSPFPFDWDIRRFEPRPLLFRMRTQNTGKSMMRALTRAGRS